MAMHIYFMGICGTAMGNSALMLAEQGHKVSGSDTGVYPPMSDRLRDGGIKILEGYDPERLENLGPDLVVVGNAISRGNPEVEWLLETRSLPFTSLPELLGQQVIANRPSIVVSGTHGKTTTTTLVSYLLDQVGKEPGWLIGGVPLDLPTGAKVGNTSAPFVIEGDEYDSAFFDKRSKFIHYRPCTLILNNLEFDHGDIFRDLEDIKRSFKHLLRLVPSKGIILYNGDDSNLRDLLPVDWAPALSVGLAEGCDLRIAEFSEDASGSSFKLIWNGLEYQVEWNMTGLFNARNAAMALLAAGLQLNRDNPFSEVPFETLKSFNGVKRRQEVLLDSEKLVVVEDFGHHPTAIAGTLESLRARYSDCRLVACFEPRSNTATTNVFQDAFTNALSKADSILLGPVHRIDKIPMECRLDTSDMTVHLKTIERLAFAYDSHEELLDGLVEETNIKLSSNARMCVVFFSNGSFGGILPQYISMQQES